MSVNGSSARLVECRVDAGIVYEKASGHVLNDKVVSQRRQATLQFDGTAWKVSSRTNETEWDGISGCAA